MLKHGYILAGGESRRFGSDKARAPLHDRTLIEGVAVVLASVAEEVAVVSAPGRSYADLGFRTIHDAHPGLGPLAGVEAALRDAEGADYVAVCACDLVGAAAAWFELLRPRRDDAAVAFHDGERWHPLLAVYSTSLLPEVVRRLEARELAVRRLLDEAARAVAPPADFAQMRSVDAPHLLPEPR